jgi:hypothetical protein
VWSGQAFRLEMRRRLHKINQTRRRDGCNPLRPVSRDKGFAKRLHQPHMARRRLRNPGPVPHGRTCPSVCERESVFSQPSLGCGGRQCDNRMTEFTILKLAIRRLDLARLERGQVEHCGADRRQSRHRLYLRRCRHVLFRRGRPILGRNRRAASVHPAGSLAGNARPVRRFFSNQGADEPDPGNGQGYPRRCRGLSG